MIFQSEVPESRVICVLQQVLKGECTRITTIISSGPGCREGTLEVLQMAVKSEEVYM